MLSPCIKNSPLRIKTDEKQPPLPEGCSYTVYARDARYSIVHVTRDENGDYHSRKGWLITDVVCEDDSRICIQYEDSPYYIDVPALEVAITRCRPLYSGKKK